MPRLYLVKNNKDGKKSLLISEKSPHVLINEISAQLKVSKNNIKVQTLGCGPKEELMKQMQDLKSGGEEPKEEEQVEEVKRSPGRPKMAEK